MFIEVAEFGVEKRPHGSEPAKLTTLCGVAATHPVGDGDRTILKPAVTINKVLSLASTVSVYIFPPLMEQQQQQGKSSDEGDEGAYALKQVFRALRQSLTAPGSALHSNQPHELEGVFRKLTNPETFRRMVMPGLSEEDRLGAPSTFEVWIT